MAFANSGNPDIDPRESDFESIAAGKYIMTGIEDFFSTDDDGYPCFKVVVGDLKAHCHFNIEGDPVSLPAWSGTVKDYMLLGKVLGADLSKIKPEPSTQFLLDIQEAINKKGATSKIEVKGDKGWVQKIDKMLPETGLYRVKFTGARSLDGSEPIAFQENRNVYNGKEIITYIVRFFFEVVADVNGDTTYAGNTVIVSVENPFEGTATNNDVRVPAWKVGANGGMLVAQRRMMQFLSVFWPEALDYEWISDPERSDYGIDEAANPIVVIAERALAGEQEAFTRLELKNGYLRMDLRDLSKAGERAQEVPFAADQKSGLHTSLMETVEKVAGFRVFDKSKGPYTPTMEGLGFLKNTVIPIWDKIKLPLDKDGKRDFAILTTMQAAELEDELSKLIKEPEENFAF